VAPGWRALGVATICSGPTALITGARRVRGGRLLFDLLIPVCLLLPPPLHLQFNDGQPFEDPRGGSGIPGADAWLNNGIQPQHSCGMVLTLQYTIPPTRAATTCQISDKRKGLHRPGRTRIALYQWEPICGSFNISTFWDAVSQL
jgi:hypothetical protein